MAVHGTLAIPEAEHQIPPSARDEIDAAVAHLRLHREAWQKLDASGRIDLLSELITDTAAVAERWVRSACNAKHISFDGPQAGEEWQSGPQLTLRLMRLFRSSLADILETGTPQLPGAVRTRPNGQVVVDVFPTDQYDKLVFPGFSGEVWMRPGVTVTNLDEHMAHTYRLGRPTKTALVLGAGNISSIPAMDVLSKLFVDNEVVLLKMNPVNEYLGPIFTDALGALIREGFLRIVYGGAAEGAYLSRHDGVDSIHLTGSDKTHDAIVFGTGEEAMVRKSEGRPVNPKPISAECGNVTPVIVVPGPWSAGDVAYQAEHIATMLLHNAGFNCIAGRVIIQDEAWPQRHHLLDALRGVMAERTPRWPYYPGAEDRWRTFVDTHPEAERFGLEGSGRVPWTLIAGLDPGNPEDICFTTEAFAGVISEVGLPASGSAAGFLDRAVAFCNQTLWGTLSATLLIHPASMDDPETAAALDRAVADLRYGSVAVNQWSGLAYAMASTPWGAYPGHEAGDIQSGRGVVHNTYMLEGPQKTVVRGPFKAVSKPPWFVTHRNGHAVLRRLTAFEADPSPRKLPGLLAASLRV